MDGYFGVNCFAKCGNCKDGELCNKTDGNCTSGCQPGWLPPLCIESKQISNVQSSVLIFQCLKQITRDPDNDIQE